jgi:hypothetical protein
VTDGSSKKVPISHSDGHRPSYNRQNLEAALSRGDDMLLKAVATARAASASGAANKKGQRKKRRKDRSIVKVVSSAPTKLSPS